MATFHAVHKHRFGVSTFRFAVPDGDELSRDDFASWLGGDYEPESGELLTVEKEEPLITLTAGQLAELRRRRRLPPR
jgi:hypothetical protein